MSVTLVRHHPWMRCEFNNKTNVSMRAGLIAVTQVSERRLRARRRLCRATTAEYERAGGRSFAYPALGAFRWVERLVSAWNQGARGDAEPEDRTDAPLIGASAEPRKRPRTPLTDEEVDAMRTACEEGVSGIALAHRYRVHRGTVWAKTRPA